MRKHDYDAVVVGAGPNGLAAAITIARKGLSVLVIEASGAVGGGMRTEELTLPGIRHDTFSAVHPMAVASPFFRSLDLESRGLRWIYPATPLAHPLDEETVTLEHSVEETAALLGPGGSAYRRVFGPLSRAWAQIATDILRPMIHIPKHPVTLACFGLPALCSARTLANFALKGRKARALFAGLAAHSFLPLDAVASASFGLVLGMMGHAVGWPIPAGGAGSIAEALANCFRELGGVIQLNRQIGNLRELPSSRATLLDMTPRQVLRVAGERFPQGYRNALTKYRYGPGIFKVDYALSTPVPWRDEGCRRAGTIHLGGTFNQIAASEWDVAKNRHPSEPFVLVSQPSVFDATRAPEGQHTLWAYCHVPKGSTFNMTDRIERQIERFAPGFRDTILARATLNTQGLEAANANLVEGDIGGGSADLGQLVARPHLSLRPYATPVRGLYICSASTPPGGGVHGMCGYHAARAALREVLR